MWTTREWDFVGDLGWRMTYVIRTSSTHHPHVVRRQVCHLYVICTCTCHPHIVCQLSAPLLMVSVGLNYLLLWQEFVIWWNLWQECCIVSFQDHVNDLRDNLCWWFSLHVASGHCSHLICICTYHLHIIWAYAYYAHIICTSPFICSFLTDNANVIYMSSLLLFIDPMMYNLVSIHCLHKHTLSMPSTCCMHIYTLFVMYLSHSLYTLLPAT